MLQIRVILSWKAKRKRFQEKITRLMWLQFNITSRWAFSSVSFICTFFSASSIASLLVCVYICIGCKFYFLLETIEKPIKPLVARFVWDFVFCFVSSLTKVKEDEKNEIRNSYVTIHKQPIDSSSYPLDSIGHDAFFLCAPSLALASVSLPVSFMDQLKHSKKRQNDI